MTAPKKPSDPKNTDGQGAQTKRSAKSKAPEQDSSSQASSSEPSSSAPPKSSPNSKARGRSTSKKTPVPPPVSLEADTLPLEILDVVDAPVAVQIPTPDLSLPISHAEVATPSAPAAKPEPAAEARVATPIAPAPRSEPAPAPEARVATQVATPPPEPARLPKSEPLPSAPRVMTTPAAVYDIPSASIKSPVSVRAKDSQPPVPSSLSINPHHDGDQEKLSPPSTRPRMSVRPANILTSYDLPLDKESLKLGVANHIEYTQGKDEFSATQLDYFMAAAHATRD